MKNLNLMYAEIMARLMLAKGDYKAALEYEKLVTRYRKELKNEPQKTM